METIYPSGCSIGWRKDDGSSIFMFVLPKKYGDDSRHVAMIIDKNDGGGVELKNDLTSQNAMKMLADNGIPIEEKSKAADFLDKHLKLSSKESEKEFEVGGEAKTPYGGFFGLLEEFVRSSYYLKKWTISYYVLGF